MLSCVKTQIPPPEPEAQSRQSNVYPGMVILPSETSASSHVSEIANSEGFGSELSVAAHHAYYDINGLH